MCTRCRELQKTEPFFIRDKVISGSGAWHLQDTHGLPMEFLPDLVREVQARLPKLRKSGGQERRNNG